MSQASENNLKHEHDHGHHMITPDQLHHHHMSQQVMASMPMHPMHPVPPHMMASMPVSSPQSHDDDDDGSTPRKKKRLRTTPEQLAILEKVFETETNPSLSKREQLSSQLGMSPRQVQVWFQNKRARVRRSKKQKMDGAPSPSGPSPTASTPVSASVPLTPGAMMMPPPPGTAPPPGAHALPFGYYPHMLQPNMGIPPGMLQPNMGIPLFDLSAFGMHHMPIPMAQALPYPLMKLSEPNYDSYLTPAEPVSLAELCIQHIARHLVSNSWDWPHERLSVEQKKRVYKYMREEGLLTKHNLHIFLDEHLDELDLTNIAGNLDTLLDFTDMETEDCLEVAQMVASRCTNLEVLKWQNQRKLTDQCLRVMLEGCQRLRVLDISHSATKLMIDDTSGGWPSYREVDFVIPEQNVLESLILSGTDLHVHSLRCIFKFCPNLTELDISDCSSDSIETKEISGMAQSLTKLKRLNLQGLNIMSDIGMKEIAQHCRDLESLSIFSEFNKVTDESLLMLAERCPNLHTLDLRWNKELSDSAIIGVAQHCQNLKSLQIEGLPKVTNLSIQTIAQTCKHLKELNINVMKGTYVHGPNVNDETLMAISNGVFKLEILSMNNCDSVSDHGLASIAKIASSFKRLHMMGSRGSELVMRDILTNTRHLEVLDLSMCEMMGDSAAIEIAKCHNLRVLSLRKCYRVTDFSVRAIARGCINLENLSLAETSITSLGATEILQFCKKLRYLDIGGCMHIPKETVQDLKTINPKVLIISEVKKQFY